MNPTATESTRIYQQCRRKYHSLRSSSRPLHQRDIDFMVDFINIARRTLTPRQWILWHLADLRNKPSAWIMRRIPGLLHHRQDYSRALERIAHTLGQAYATTQPFPLWRGSLLAYYTRPSRLAPVSYLKEWKQRTPAETLAMARAERPTRGRPKAKGAAA